MNILLVSNYVFKITGGLLFIYAILGITLALFSILSLEHLETMDFNQVLKEHNANDVTHLSDEETQDILAKLPEIVTSRDFSVFYWGMMAYGFVTNILLIYFGYQLLTTKHMYAWWYILLMSVSYSYMHLAPSFLATESPQALAFGAAWGIGNMGISLLLYTHFWIWGPSLAFIGLVTHYISHNKSFNTDGANNAPPC